MNERPPDAEALVDESWLAHGGVTNVPITTENGRSLDPAVKFGFVVVEHNDPLDKLGVDRFLNVKIRGGWQWVAIQIKTSSSGDTVGVVLPIRNPPPPKLMARLSPGMIHKIAVHDYKHCAVDSVLFVDAWGSLTNKAGVLEEIWRETKRIVNVRFKLLTGHYVW